MDTSPYMPRMMISYSRVDRSFVEELAGQLRRAYNNHDCVWYDDDIVAGEFWRPTIFYNIEYRPIILYVMTNDSLASDMCKAEIEEAKKLKRIIIPILARRKTNIPDEFSHIQYVDMSEGRVTLENFTELQRAISTQANNLAQPIELPTSHNETKSEKLASDYQISIPDLPSQPQRILIEAGPGTGKTREIITRVSQLLKEDIDPSHIMLVTFTRRAAADMKEKLSRYEVPNASKIWCGTLHSFCFAILNSSGYLLQSDRIARPLHKFERDFLLTDINNIPKFGDIHKKDNRLKAFEAGWARNPLQNPLEIPDAIDQEFESLMLTWLRFHKAMLIEEVVKEVLRYLRNNPNWNQIIKFEHILVDEYQDLNRADQMVIDLLAENANLVVVGDRNQSIYSFRYAHPEGIINFGSEHVRAEILPKLTQSYRCPANIARAARTLIRNSELTHINQENAGNINVVTWESLETEARGIAQFVHKRIHQDGINPSQILILSPIRQSGYMIRDSLKNDFKINAHSFFTEELLDSDEAKAAFTLLKLLNQPEDMIALRCWLGLGHKQKRHTEYHRIYDWCKKRGGTPKSVLQGLASGTLEIPHTNGIVRRYQELDSAIRNLKNMSDREKLDYLFPSDQDWAKPFRVSIPSEESEDFDLNTLLQLITDQIIQPELQEDTEFVRIMSLHSSKGLEADIVVITGCIDGLIPRRQDETLPIEERDRQRDEHRRLFYVAITRSRQELVLSIPQSIPRNLAHRVTMNMPRYGGDVRTSTSRFIADDLGSVLPRVQTGESWRY